MLTPLLNVSARDVDSRARVEAIAILDEQLADSGCFLLGDGTVLLLRLTRRGWSVSYWEPPP